MTRKERLAARRACHGNRLCCQYVDRPNCNSAKDVHPLGRAAFWLRSLRERLES